MECEIELERPLLKYWCFELIYLQALNVSQSNGFEDVDALAEGLKYWTNNLQTLD